MNTPHLNQLYEKIRTKLETKKSFFNEYINEASSDIAFAKEALKKTKEKIPAEIDSFKRTITNMKNIIIIFFMYAIIIMTITARTSGYGGSFLENFLVNANSSILDFLVLGVILYYLEHKKQHKEVIVDLTENLENLAKYGSVELNIMKLKILKQLNEKGVANVKVQRIELNGLAAIKNLHFVDADLNSINMSESYIKKCTFERCNLNAMNINKSRLREVTFKNCNLKNIKANCVDFQNVSFEECNFDGGFFMKGKMRSSLLRGCNFKNVTYTDADMRSVNLRGGKNIDIEKIIHAGSLDYLICDKAIEDELKRTGLKIKFSKRGSEARESNPNQ